MTPCLITFHQIRTKTLIKFLLHMNTFPKTGNFLGTISRHTQSDKEFLYLEVFRAKLIYLLLKIT